MVYSSPRRPALVWIGVLLGAFLGRPDPVRADEGAQKVAIQFVLDAILNRDADAAVKHFAEDVQRGTQQGQDVIDGFRKELQRLPKDRPLNLQEIRFFDKRDLEDVVKAFQPHAEGRVQWEALEAKLDDAHGCLLRFQPEPDENAMLMILVLKRFDDGYKIVYEDDN